MVVSTHLYDKSEDYSPSQLSRFCSAITYESFTALAVKYSLKVHSWSAIHNTRPNKWFCNQPKPRNFIPLPVGRVKKSCKKKERVICNGTIELLWIATNYKTSLVKKNLNCETRIWYYLISSQFIIVFQTSEVWKFIGRATYLRHFTPLSPTENLHPEFQETM